MGTNIKGWDLQMMENLSFGIITSKVVGARDNNIFI